MPSCSGLLSDTAEFSTWGHIFPHNAQNGFLSSYIGNFQQQQKCFFLKSQGFNPKIRLLGQKVCLVARWLTDRHTRQPGDSLSGFLEFFLQLVIKDRSIKVKVPTENRLDSFSNVSEFSLCRNINILVIAHTVFHEIIRHEFLFLKYAKIYINYVDIPNFPEKYKYFVQMFREKNNYISHTNFGKKSNCYKIETHLKKAKLFFRLRLFFLTCVLFFFRCLEPSFWKHRKFGIWVWRMIPPK